MPLQGKSQRGTMIPRKIDASDAALRELVAEIDKSSAPRSAPDISDIVAMKPETREKPFSQPGWLFELKYDGFRMLAERRAGTPRLLYRSGHDATAIFPEIARAVAALPCDLVLDGEAVSLDETGRPVFQLLQRRALRTRRIDVEQAAVATPATFFAFDLLVCAGHDLRPLPLAERKALLARLFALLPETPLRLIEALPERGEDLYAAVQGLGLEGIVAKRADSPYRGGYSPHWLKVRVDQTADFAILGFEPEGKTGFRKLHLGVRLGDGWGYAGTVGTGFDAAETREIRARLEPARRPQPPLSGISKPPGVRAAVWVEPELVAEVRYKEVTAGGHLRQPVFLRLREDKRPEECLPAGEDLAGDSEPPEPAPLPAAFASFTNLDKVFWPDEGYTKGDLIDFYRAIAPWMLPYLRDRPLVLDRYPDGITGKSFFQKHALEKTEGPQTDYFLCEDVDSLLRLVNLGAIPFHIWASRLPDLDRPDWCILDLDPKGAPFSWVVRIAREARALCEEIGLPSLVKTSGGSGLHILLPLGRQHGHDTSRQLAEVLARLLTDRLPEIATTARAIPARKGRVYVDALQNGRGKLLAAPFSARPRPGATVSTPLDWSEVGPRLDPSRFTIRTVPRRMQRRIDDPLLPVLSLQPDLMAALSRLAELLAEPPEAE
jgi:bifunctional non-homologous end joining protein LigD